MIAPRLNPRFIAQIQVDFLSSVSYSHLELYRFFLSFFFFVHEIKTFMMVSNSITNDNISR